MLLVALISVEAGKLDEFHKYEHAAAQIMARYNGVIERAIALPGVVTLPKATAPAPKRGGIMGAIEGVASEIDRSVEKLLHPDEQGYRELHILRFPDEAAYDAYRADPEIIALAPERAKCVSKTELWRAAEGPRY
ncbi:MAG: hypothetical protein AB7T06_05075 [Kofleriaceae bacterium]